MFETAFDHLHLRSLDPDAAARFYVEHLGATPADRIEAPDSLRVVVELGGIRLFIERAPEGMRVAAQAPHRGLEHLALKVPDLDQAASALRGNGVTFTMEPKQIKPGTKIAFIQGPDGVLIELLERAGG